MNDEPWYGAKCIFLHTQIEGCPGQVYEERVVLTKATSLDDAIQRAESLAKEYASDCGGCSYTGFINVFHIYDENIGDGSEVYSLMRTSELSTNAYLDQFYDTGMERTQK